ncbi:hypothetical protein NL676_033420 [Syzygium grande]|nr:hypothetical protein NL676_033420 [Syzygium grande]
MRAIFVGDGEEQEPAPVLFSMKWEIKPSMVYLILIAATDLRTPSAAPSPIEASFLRVDAFGEAGSDQCRFRGSRPRRSGEAARTEKTKGKKSKKKEEEKDERPCRSTTTERPKKYGGDEGERAERLCAVPHCLFWRYLDFPGKSEIEMENDDSLFFYFLGFLRYGKRNVQRRARNWARRDVCRLDDQDSKYDRVVNDIAFRIENDDGRYRLFGVPGVWSLPYPHRNAMSPL